MPIVSVWAFQLDGIFIGATRGRDLRNSMLVSFLVYLALAVLLERAFGNNGLWCALVSFMVLRSITLGLRLPRIESVFVEPVPVS
jgi:MATE family multidrug resistance protein